MYWILDRSFSHRAPALELVARGAFSMSAARITPSLCDALAQALIYSCASDSLLCTSRTSAAFVSCCSQLAGMADGSANVKATNKAEWGRTASQYSAMTLAPGETKGIGRPLYGAYVNALSNGSQKSLRILDVSSGAGEPALSLAQALPDSTVQLTDIAPEMLAEASRRAQDMGIKNTRCCCWWHAGSMRTVMASRQKCNEIAPPCGLQVCTG